MVFVNGPKRSGKDTAALFAVKHFGARHYKMAAPLKNAIASFFGLDGYEEKRYYETDEKDREAERFFGHIPRQVLISLSENWAKPLFGKDVFGRHAIRFIQEPTQAPFTVISDSGFRSEAEPIVGWLGAKRCLLIQLSRPGSTFEGDSRSYIELDDLGVTTVQIHNAHEKDIYEMQVERAIRKWLDTFQGESWIKPERFDRT